MSERISLPNNDDLDAYTLMVNKHHKMEGNLALKPEAKSTEAVKDFQLRELATRELTPEARKRLRALARKKKQQRKMMFWGIAGLAGLTAVGGLVGEVVGSFRGSERTTLKPESEKPTTSQVEMHEGELASEQQYQEMVDGVTVGTGEGDGATGTESEEVVDAIEASESELTTEEIAARRQENYQALRTLALERWVSTEGASAMAYVPVDDGVPNEHDGITGPYGYNFAGRTETQLKNDGFSEAEVTAFEQLTKLYGQEALNYITNNPITFTDQQMTLMREANVAAVLDRGLEKYRADGIELLDLDPRIAVASLQPYGLYGPNIDFSEHQGEENVYGDLARYEVSLKNQDWVTAADSYAQVINRYWNNPEGKFNVGWGNRYHEYFQNDLLPGLLATEPELESELLMVAEKLGEPAMT